MMVLVEKRIMMTDWYYFCNFHESYVFIDLLSSLVVQGLDVQDLVD